ncbi:MAG: hypothetical protein U5K38_08550 [Woeseiaceae bacterium]|nr:hypothetical protein [Woeseiaceae bacterium]
MAPDRRRVPSQSGYSAVRQSLGEPDLFRLRYRTTLITCRRKRASRLEGNTYSLLETERLP